MSHIIYIVFYTQLSDTIPKTRYHRIIINSDPSHFSIRICQLRVHDCEVEDTISTRLIWYTKQTNKKLLVLTMFH